MVEVKLQEPDAGIVKLVVWLTLPAPATAVVFAPAQVDEVFGPAALTSPGA